MINGLTLDSGFWTTGGCSCGAGDPGKWLLVQRVLTLTHELASDLLSMLNGHFLAGELADSHLGGEW